MYFSLKGMHSNVLSYSYVVVYDIFQDRWQAVDQDQKRGKTVHLSSANRVRM